MTHLNFSKMHGLGNDFVVIDAIHQTLDVSRLPIALLANRHTGIGCDQVLVITPSDKADVGCRIFNADGSEAEQCGNGLRCVARFVQTKQRLDKPSLTIETKAGIFDAFISDPMIRVMMGTPCFEAKRIPFVSSANTSVCAFDFEHAGTAYTGTVLSMGNPHVILRVDSVMDFPVATVGSLIATHTAFPQGTNVGFMEVISPHQIRLRTFERGVGETYSCGSNACAAVVAGILKAGLDPKVSVELALGQLQIEWDGIGKPVFMTGPAVFVFDGTIK